MLCSFHFGMGLPVASAGVARAGACFFGGGYFFFDPGKPPNESSYFKPCPDASVASLWAFMLKTFLFLLAVFAHMFSCFSIASALNLRPQCRHSTRYYDP
jgi:hypothetical protein